MDYSTELFKTLLTVVLSSGIVAIYYQSRLKRVGSYEAVTKTMMDRMLQGIEKVYEIVKRIHKSVAELEDVINNDSISSKKLTEISEDIARNIDVFKEALSMHRIYITSLIPLDGSSKYLGAYTGIVMGIMILVEVNKKSVDDISPIKSKLVQSIDRVNSLHREVCSNILDIKKKIMSGDIVV